MKDVNAPVADVERVDHESIEFDPIDSLLISVISAQAALLLASGLMEGFGVIAAALFRG
ncbi:MAG: hypothetical protein O2845_05805 [Proteobacteria bacterium]|nr:hypothetical protein [Pseudomonadota bacterium]